MNDHSNWYRERYPKMMGESPEQFEARVRAADGKAWREKMQAEGAEFGSFTVEEADPGGSVSDYIVRTDKERAETREPVAHYATPGGIETIDFIKSLGWLEQFSLANCIKYISRAGRKDHNSKLGDLKKARTYLNFVIQELESETETE